MKKIKQNSVKLGIMLGFVLQIGCFYSSIQCSSGVRNPVCQRSADAHGREAEQQALDAMPTGQLEVLPHAVEDLRQAGAFDAGIRYLPTTAEFDEPAEVQVGNDDVVTQVMRHDRQNHTDEDQSSDGCFARLICLFCCCSRSA